MNRFGINDTDEDSGMSGGQILLWILLGIIADGLLASFIILCLCSESSRRKLKTLSENLKASEKELNKNKKDNAPLPQNLPVKRNVAREKAEGEA